MKYAGNVASAYPGHSTAATTAPLTAADGTVNGVLQPGFLHPIDNKVMEQLGRVSELLGAAVRSAQYRAHIRNLLEQTQRQAEELQVQKKELPDSNEELSEQGEVLRTSQARVELQRRELEHANVQVAE